MHLCALFPFFHIAPRRLGRSYAALKNSVLQILPSPQRRWCTCQAKQCYSVKNVAHTISYKSIGLQTSAYFPPLIIMDYTETEGVFASCRRPKGASGGRQLAQCSTPSEPFPTAYITEGMSDHTSPSIYSWLLSRMVTCVYQYLHWPDFTTTKGPLHHWAF